MANDWTEKDDDPLARFKCGDGAAFSELVERYEGKLLRIISRMVGSQLADDTLQDCWMKVFQAACAYKPDGKLDRWLTRVARRTALEQLRHHRTWKVRILHSSPKPLEACEAVAHELDKLDVSRLRAALLRRQRPLELRVLELLLNEHSWSEVQEKLQLDEEALQNVRSFLQRLVEQLHSGQQVNRGRNQRRHRA
ncbi:MAG: sigma-70 family RNA polymerase sigma factor [Planctomycetes bacterium]|nr:sigma-70 family RNA polymerase sigma factor [Planctomycetota bacterium]